MTKNAAPTTMRVTTKEPVHRHIEEGMVMQYRDEQGVLQNYGIESISEDRHTVVLRRLKVDYAGTLDPMGPLH